MDCPQERLYLKRKATMQAAIITSCRVFVAGLNLAATQFVIEELARKGFHHKHSHTLQSLLGWWAVWGNAWVMILTRFKKAYDGLLPHRTSLRVNTGTLPITAHNRIQLYQQRYDSYVYLPLSIPVSFFYLTVQYFGINALMAALSGQEKTDTMPLVVSGGLTLGVFCTFYFFSLQPMHQAIRSFIAWCSNPDIDHRIPIHPSQLIFWQASLGLIGLSTQGIFGATKLIEKIGVEEGDPAWWSIAIPTFLFYMIFNAFTRTHAQLKEAGILTGQHSREPISLTGYKKWIHSFFQYSCGIPDIISTGFSYMAGCMVTLNRSKEIDQLEGLPYGLYWLSLAFMCSFATHAYWKFSVTPAYQNVAVLLNDPDRALSEMRTVLCSRSRLQTPLLESEKNRLSFAQNNPDQQTEQAYKFNAKK